MYPDMPTYQNDKEGSKREGNGERCPPPQLTEGLGEHHKLPSVVWSRMGAPVNHV